MRTKIYNFIIIITFLFLLIEIMTNKILIFDTIKYSLNIWITSIVPSIFPFFIISDILISYNITNYIPKFIKYLFNKLFNTSNNIITIFFLSIISGFPSNARITRKLLDMNNITTVEANHALIFTHFSNPLFILGTVSVFFLHNNTYGIIILISHYLSNIIVGILFRKYSINNKNNYAHNINNQNLSIILITSIKNSIDTLLLILGTLTCFLILSAIIINRLNLGLYNSCLLKGLLEITMGLKALSTLNINDIYKVVISTMFISFGGLSVHMQVISQIIGSNIKYKYFLTGRIYQTIISGLLAYILYIAIIH